MNRTNQVADAVKHVLRVSMDAKAIVKIGPFSRGGKSHVAVQAAEHDFKPDGTLTPVGIILVQFDDLFLYMVTSKVTADCLVDCLECWWLSVCDRFAPIDTLVLNLDNGPENYSRRTQFIKRIVDFIDTVRLTVHLAYYPPYHSKYNPIERVWGGLEQHWNGSLLDTISTALKFAQTLVCRGRHLMVHLLVKTYHTGIRLTPQAMHQLEQRLERLPTLSKWFFRITPSPV